jgi:hypothetical protein
MTVQKHDALDAVALWPLSSCGLAPRVANALAASRVRRVTQLRALPRDGLRGIGPRGRQAVHDFLELCDGIETGAVQKLAPAAILSRLLPPRTCELLELRYGLRNELPPASGPCLTLHEAGLRLGLVRERVRQLEREARRLLGALPARAALAPLRLRFEACMEACGGIADEGDVAAALPAQALDGYHAAAFLRLCCDCQGWFSTHRSFFSRLPAGALRDVESAALRELSASRSLRTLRDLAARLPLPSALGAPERERLVTRLLPRVPRITATRAGEVFLYGSGLPALIEAHLKAHGPSEAGTIFNGINAALLPGGRKSLQVFLRILRNDPRFVAREDRRFDFQR